MDGTITENWTEGESMSTRRQNWSYTHTGAETGWSLCLCFMVNLQNLLFFSIVTCFPTQTFLWILLTALPKVRQVARLSTNKKHGRVFSLFGPRNAHFDMKSICERHVKQPAIVRCFFVPFRGRFIWNHQCGKPIPMDPNTLLLRTIPTPIHPQCDLVLRCND